MLKKLNIARLYRRAFLKITRRQKVVLSGFFFSSLIVLMLVAILFFANVTIWHELSHEPLREKLFLASMVMDSMR